MARLVQLVHWMLSLVIGEGSGRFSPALWVALVAAGGPLCLVAPWPTCVAGAALWLCFRRQVSWRVLAIGVLAATSGIVRARAVLAEYGADRARAAALVRPPTRCVVRGRVIESPTVRDGATRFAAVIRSGTCDEQAFPSGIKVRLYGGPDDLARGDEIEAIVQLGVPRLFRNHELPDPILLTASDGIAASGSALSLTVVERGRSLVTAIDRARAFVRLRISATFAPHAVGLAKALVLGENDLTDEEDQSFKVSGLAHLLAVSGTHLVFAVVAVTAGLRAVLSRFTGLTKAVDVARPACLAGAGLALAYADFAGGSGSAWRAAWMLASAFGLRALGRQVRAPESVGASVLVGLLFDPLIPLDLSFVLSVAATGGLMTLGRAWGQMAARVRHSGLRRLGESLAATLAATIPCSLLLAPLATEASLIGLVANTLAAPFGEAIALPLCLTHCLTAWWPALERGIGLVASGALLVVRQLALQSARAAGFGVPLPYPDGWQYSAVFTVACAAFSLWSARQTRTRWVAHLVLLWGVAQWTVAEVRLRADGKPHVLRVTFLDVEQGDSALVDLPDGRLMLIDGGGFVGTSVDPGRSVILPVLRRRRRAHLDVVALSHPHPDHFGGLVSVMRGVRVTEFWDTGQGRSEGAGPVYAELLEVASRRGVEVKALSALCELRSYGGADLAVLSPCPDFEPFGPANDNSLVLRFSHSGRSVLFVGDAELAQEEKLVATASDRLVSEVLKVGHHGSRTSSSAPFLTHVRPQLAVISCGIRNRFGHPHATTLSRLNSYGIETWRTDEGGSLRWPAD